MKIGMLNRPIGSLWEVTTITIFYSSQGSNNLFKSPPVRVSEINESSRKTVTIKKKLQCNWITWETIMDTRWLQPVMRSQEVRTRVQESLKDSNIDNTQDGSRAGAATKGFPHHGESNHSSWYREVHRMTLTARAQAAFLFCMMAASSSSNVLLAYDSLCTSDISVPQGRCRHQKCLGRFEGIIRANHMRTWLYKCPWDVTSAILCADNLQ